MKHKAQTFEFGRGVKLIGAKRGVPQVVSVPQQRHLLPQRLLEKLAALREHLLHQSLGSMVDHVEESVLHASLQNHSTPHHTNHATSSPHPRNIAGPRRNCHGEEGAHLSDGFGGGSEVGGREVHHGEIQAIPGGGDHLRLPAASPAGKCLLLVASAAIHFRRLYPWTGLTGGPAVDKQHTAQLQ